VCGEQKARFGSAAKLLPYVEGDAKSPIAEPARCNAASVRAYPTWIINGQRYEGLKTLDELAGASAFTPSGS
jgi:hypothetical protein